MTDEKQKEQSGPATITQVPTVRTWWRVCAKPTEGKKCLCNDNDKHWSVKARTADGARACVADLDPLFEIHCVKQRDKPPAVGTAILIEVDNPGYSKEKGSRPKDIGRAKLKKAWYERAHFKPHKHL